MSHMNTVIEDLVSGKTFRVTRRVHRIPSGQLVTKAYFTVKASINDLDSAAKIQNMITTLQTAQGVILDQGASGTALLQFDLTPSQTANLVAGTEYVFDVEIITDAGQPFTVDGGTITAEAPVTRTNV